MSYTCVGNKRLVPSNTTLVVAPVSLIYQWEQEIRKHCKDEHMPNIVLYHAQNRPKKVQKLGFFYLEEHYTTCPLAPA